MSIPRIAVQRPVMMFMISTVIVLIGTISLTRLPVDLMPDIGFPSVSIRVGYPNVGPLEIEEIITRPLEEAVSAVAGLQQVNSTSSEGFSMVRLNFAWGTNLNEATDDVRTRIDRIRGRLPTEADAPTIMKFDSNSQPIMEIGVEADLSRVALRELAENTLSQRLERAPGVASVTVDGGLRRQIHVDLSKEKITALNLPVDRVVTLLRRENQNIPLGEMDEGDRTYLVRSEGQFQSLEDINSLVVMTKQNVPVYLRDIADVKDSTEDYRSFLRIDGRPGVRLRVTKQSGGNTVEVATNVKAEIERINREMAGAGVKLSVLNDSALFIERAITNVQHHALTGGVLVVLIIFAFLRSARSTLIVCTSLPISIIGTFALMYFGGFTLNTMTFGGLALGVGMIVDAAIVVLENSYRHMEMGKDRVKASIEGAEEVWSAIVASTLTHIAVFFPLLFLSGVSSVLFKQLSVVVIFSLSMSLFVAVTLVPVLCSRLLVLPEKGVRRSWTSRMQANGQRALDEIDSRYRRLLHRSLMHRPTVLGVGVGLFVLALLILPTIGTEMIAQADEGEVSVNAELPIGTRVNRTEAVMLRLEEMVRQYVPEAQTIITSGGGGGGPMGGSGSSRGSLTLRLVPKEQRTRSSDQIAQELRRQLSGLPGVIVRARASGVNMQMNRMLSGGGGGGSSRLALEVRGHDLTIARQLAQRSVELMTATPGIADAQVGRDEGRPERAIMVDRPKAALLGLGFADVANTLATNIGGTRAANFRSGGFEYPIVVRLRAEDRDRVEDINDVLLSTSQGQVIQAKNLLNIQNQSGPVQIERKNQERIVNVGAEIETTLSDAVRNVTDRLPQLSAPRDFTVGFGSEVEEQAKSFRQLQLILVLAIILVYAVMASQYESLRDPLIIMFSIPLAAIGVVLALKLTGTPFNLQAYIGVIMLAGIVVSNAILLVDYTNTLRRRDGLPLREAVEVAGRTRLRPILMTSFATMLGLVPMASGLGEGSEMQTPLARVVIGGLLTSTMITLVFVPTVYTLFEEGLSGLRRDRSRNAIGVTEPQAAKQE